MCGMEPPHSTADPLEVHGVKTNRNYHWINGAAPDSPLIAAIGWPVFWRFAGGGAGSSSSESVRSITSAIGRLLPDLGMEEPSREPPVSGVATLCAANRFGVARFLPLAAKLTIKASSSSSM